MKKLFPVLCCFMVFSCQETKKKNPQTKEIHPLEESFPKASVPTENLCFLSTIGSSNVNGRAIQDSLILKLEIGEGRVSGTFDWVPAEKDARRGSVYAKKKDGIITGEYVFRQEGKKQTQPIQIHIHEHFAKVTTNLGQSGEMTVEIEKTGCP